MLFCNICKTNVEEKSILCNVYASVINCNITDRTDPYSFWSSKHKRECENGNDDKHLRHLKVYPFHTQVIPHPYSKIEVKGRLFFMLCLVLQTHTWNTNNTNNLYLIHITHEKFKFNTKQITDKVQIPAWLILWFLVIECVWI